MINYLMMPYLRMWHRKFMKASQDSNMQYSILKRIINDNAGTEYGKKHNFSNILNYEDFRKLPITDYNYYRHYISSICNGDLNVLTREKVILMEPTSGTTSGTKLIPYTKSLQNDFKKGIYPWLYDLYSNNRQLLGGKAYWSLSPSTAHEYTCKLPVGFLKDSEYLGFIGRFIEQSMAVPSSVSAIRDTEQWKMTTCAHLLINKNLRFISVWNPQFLTILLEYIRTHKIELCDFIENKGTVPCSQVRLEEINSALKDNVDFQVLWPNLHTVSCWADGYAELSLEPLRSILPFVHIQPKGLISSEAFVSFPLTGYGNVLSVMSHFFEFKSEDGNIYTAYNLEHGRRYTVLITTSGGLYRYNLNDVVEVTGFFNKLPCLRFIGRNTRTLDFFGEKLEENFIFSIIRRRVNELFKPGFAAFIPCFEDGFHYSLYIGTDVRHSLPEAESMIETDLCMNYHYRHARNVGQIGRFRLIANDSKSLTEKYLSYMQSKGLKLGNIKPVVITDDIELFKVF